MTATVTALGAVGATSGVPTFSTAVDVEVGDYIVVFGGGNLNGSIALTISDAFGNTYTAQTESATSSSPVNRINTAVCQVTTRVPAGSTITCQVASGARGQQVYCAASVTGLTSSALDASPTPTDSSSSGTTVTWPATGTLAQADEVQLAFVMAGNVSGSISAMSGWDPVNSVTSGARCGSLRTRTVSSTATSTPTATLAVSTSWAAALVSLKIDTTPPPAGADVPVLDFIPI